MASAGPKRSSAIASDFVCPHIGVVSIDDQHKELAALINQLNAQLADGASAALLQATLERLSVWTDIHFRQEETLCTSSRYPRAEQHLREHRHLRLIFTRFRQAFDPVHAFDDVTNHVRFLCEWLTRHIDKEDRALAAHLNSLGIR